MGFPRQEYWSGLPFPPRGDLPDPGIEPRSLTLQADCLLSEPPRKPLFKKKEKRLQLNVEIKLPLTPSLLWFMNSAHIWFRKRNVKVLLPLSHMFL